MSFFCWSERHLHPSPGKQQGAHTWFWVLSLAVLHLYLMVTWLCASPQITWMVFLLSKYLIFYHQYKQQIQENDTEIDYICFTAVICFTALERRPEIWHIYFTIKLSWQVLFNHVSQDNSLQKFLSDSWNNGQSACQRQHWTSRVKGATMLWVMWPDFSSGFELQKAAANQTQIPCSQVVRIEQMYNYQSCSWCFTSTWKHHFYRKTNKGLCCVSSSYFITAFLTLYS